MTGRFRPVGGGGGSAGMAAWRWPWRRWSWRSPRLRRGPWLSPQPRQLRRPCPPRRPRPWAAVGRTRPRRTRTCRPSPPPFGATCLGRPPPTTRRWRWAWTRRATSTWRARRRRTGARAPPGAPACRATRAAGQTCGWPSSPPRPRWCGCAAPARPPVRRRPPWPLAARRWRPHHGCGWRRRPHHGRRRRQRPHHGRRRRRRPHYGRS